MSTFLSLPQARRRALKIIAIIMFMESLPLCLHFPGAFGIPAAFSASERKVSPTTSTLKTVAPDKERPGDEAAAGLTENPSAVKEAQQAFRRREKELDDRERDLERREQALQTIKKEIDVKLDELAENRKKLDQDLAKLNTGLSDKKQEELAAAVKIYRGMEPQAAAKYFNEMEVGLVIEVLKQMSASQSSGILTAMRAEVEQIADKPVGTDTGQESEKALRLKRLKEIGERLVHPPEGDKP
jgi:flagellar motility protein MotE (MotC chaperone)